MKAYCAQPQVVTGGISYGIPTFYLFRSVQGIVSQEHAERIVHSMFNPTKNPDIVVHPNVNLVDVIEEFEEDYMSERDKFVKSVIDSTKQSAINNNSPLTEADIDSLAKDVIEMFERGFTLEDARSYLRCREEVNPELSEEIALKRMADINKKYRSKNG